MDILKSTRLTNAEYWEEAKEEVLRYQKEELLDGLFSTPEGVWHNIRWYADVDIQKANSLSFNVSSTLYLAISDPLELENILQGKLNRLYRRLLEVETLCLDMYKGDDELSAANRPDIKERMTALGLLECD